MTFSHKQCTLKHFGERPLTSGSGHAVALPADPADAGLAVRSCLEELEVEGLHGLLLGLGLLAGGGSGGSHISHRLHTRQESHVIETGVPHIDLSQIGNRKENVSTRQTTETYEGHIEHR